MAKFRFGTLALLEMIHRQWSALIPRFTSEQFDYALRKGMFTILLDALDEVDFDLRDRVGKEIVGLSIKYPECRMLVTSRPDDRFGGWSEFFVAEIEPLSKKQVVELVTKINFDKSTKEKFLKEIDSRLGSTHKEFLSNPLLCTMMLMTYNEFEEIPSKIHIFYQRAYEVLFSRHDKTKPSFKRKFFTKMPEDDFAKLFSSFCLVSYLDRKIAFDRKGAIKYIDAAKHLDRVNLESGDFLRDLVESTSILLREGDEYTFLHRSFQEYFTAVFLSDRQVPKMDELFIPIAARYYSDSVINLLAEMKREALELNYLPAVVGRLKKEIGEIGGSQYSSKLLSLFVVEFTWRRAKKKNEIASYRPTSWSYILGMIDRFYFQSSAFQNLNSPPFNWWNAVINNCAARGLGRIIDEEVAAERGYEGKFLEMKDVPDECLKDTELYKCAVEACKDVDRLEQRLKEAVAQKTDLVGDLLKQFES